MVIDLDDGGRDGVSTVKSQKRRNSGEAELTVTVRDKASRSMVGGGGVGGEVEGIADLQDTLKVVICPSEGPGR